MGRARHSCDHPATKMCLTQMLKVYVPRQILGFPSEGRRGKSDSFSEYMMASSREQEPCSQEYDGDFGTTRELVSPLSIFPKYRRLGVSDIAQLEPQKYRRPARRLKNRRLGVSNTGGRLHSLLRDLEILPVALYLYI